MARNTLNVQFDLTSIKCHDEGDGLGSAEPYLWTVFFLVDGSTISVNSGLTLSGQATMHFTPGSHGNLPNDDVDAGETVSIPAAIGEWQTLMKPIPVPPPFDAAQPDVGGVTGVVCVLMEEDNVSDDGAAAGKTALNNAVRSAVNQIVATRSLTNQEVSEGELKQFEGAIKSAVEDAIKNQQSFFENLWSWLNPDDTIGFQVFLFSHDELASKGTISFSKRWKNEGDWEIFGNVTGTVTCPANALDNLFSSVNSSSSLDLDRMRKIRDDRLRKFPGVDKWWGLAERNLPEAVRILSEDAELRGQAEKLMQVVTDAVDQPDADVSDDQLKELDVFFGALAERSVSRRLRIDARRAQEATRLVTRGRADGVLKFLGTFSPARRQTERLKPLEPRADRERP
ncbi:MAG: hypothetical protein QM619_07800 [Micropruina sp.]|uniref:hypothetical protein n=1 Tax=Micropruina sp. TaxID=2737536 RepID=UPI0039E5AA1B